MMPNTYVHRTLSNVKTFDDIQSSHMPSNTTGSNGLSLNLPCHGSVPKHLVTSIDNVYYRNHREEVPSGYYSNKDILQKEPITLSKIAADTNNLIENGNVNVTSELSREEIVARRKLKVIELRKKKKLEKQRLSAESECVENSIEDFVLNSNPDEFPDLSVANNNKKRVKTVIPQVASENDDCVEGNRKLTKGTEKSWKPKVKDPILIKIDQVLQVKSQSQKEKVVTKKVDPTAQRNVARGNILDSDNPQQKKGKVRPDKQKKPTKLKKHILLERNERQTQREKEDNTENCDETATDPNGANMYTLCALTKGDVEDYVVGSNNPINLPVESSDLSDSIKHSSTNNNQEDIINLKHTTKFDPEKSVHSRKFREYCTNCVTPEVITSVCALLEKLAYFQDRTFAKDPIRAQAKRRYVAGINQTNKYLVIKKVKLLVIAPDLEKSSGEGGLDKIISDLKNEGDKQSVPYVFGPQRKRLAKAVFKNALVSCVAVLSYEGAEEQFSCVLEALNVAKIQYQLLTNSGPCDSVEKELEESRQETVTGDNKEAIDVTSSLLAALREESSPAERLLSAIFKNE